ncbi:MAG: acyl--CoA ligase, partial [Lachnospiraceae bacterium]|nr:acyl--CoA ligase [Lachnospiraceae bacterium]
MDSIVQALSIHAKETPDRIAVIADDEQITYGELWKEVQGFAEFLRKQGFEKGSRITVKAAPSIWFAVSCFGIHLSGNVHVPMEKTIGPEGIINIADELSASMIVADTDLSDRISENDGKYKYISSALVRETAKAYYRDGLVFDFPTLDMTCDIMFTTGTTGKSKGVMESHRAVVAVSENVQYGAEIPKDNIYLVPAPINHASAIRKLYVSILT